MCGRRAVLLAACVGLVLVLVVLVAAACGGGTTTTAGPTTTTAGPTTTAAPTTTGTPIDAAALYAQNCKGCHADGVTGSASEIGTIIADGKDTTMPAFSGKLSADQITALAEYAAGGGK